MMITIDASTQKRIFKGQSILVPISDFVVIDLETTGLDPEFDSIIELGAVRYKDGVPTAEFSSLVNPGFSIDDFISELTGITNDMLSTAPSIQDVLPEYIKFIGEDIIIGHNVSFDINFLYDTAEKLNLPVISNSFIDTMRLSRRLFPEFNHHRLSDLVSRYNIAPHKQHRALGDCYTTADCYLYLKSYANQNDISFESLCKRNRHSLKASEVTSSSTSFDTSHPLYGKLCVFTGTLQRMLRKDAMQAVVDVGGQCGDRITKDTNFLILGNNDYCSQIKDGKSNKQKKAEQYKLKGQDIEIISEDVFYDLLSIT